MSNVMEANPSGNDKNQVEEFHQNSKFKIMTEIAQLSDEREKLISSLIHHPKDDNEERANFTINKKIAEIDLKIQQAKDSLNALKANTVSAEPAESTGVELTGAVEAKIEDEIAKYPPSGPDKDVRVPSSATTEAASFVTPTAPPTVDLSPVSAPTPPTGFDPAGIIEYTGRGSKKSYVLRPGKPWLASATTSAPSRSPASPPAVDAAPLTSAPVMAVIPEEPPMSPEERARTFGSAFSGVRSLENRALLHKMSHPGMEVLGQAYEAVKMVPGVARVIGKMGIAYNRFWINRHEKKAVKLKGKLDNFDMNINSLSQVQEELRTQIKALNQGGVPGSEPLELEIKKMDDQKAKILLKRDEVQTKFEARDNKVKNYTNERDRIATGLIERYGEKMRPMEQQLERIERRRDEANLLCSLMEAKHSEQNAKLEDLEERKRKLEDTLRKMNKSDRQIRKTQALRALEAQILRGKNQIRVDKELLRKEFDDINSKVAKAEAKVNPIRDKQAVFIRVKEGRALQIDVATRENKEEFTDMEVVSSRNREASVSSGIEALPESTETTLEGAVAEKEKWNVGDFVTGWNAYLDEKFASNMPGEKINLEDFMRDITSLAPVERIDFRYFKEILTRYYKYKFGRNPSAELVSAMGGFYNDKVKA